VVHRCHSFSPAPEHLLIPNCSQPCPRRSNSFLSGIKERTLVIMWRRVSGFSESL
ncbi:hypothetical protein DNTS_004088, partial [Danionella cerebrum]